MSRAEFNASLDETHTKRGRARLARDAHDEFALPLTFAATADDGEKRVWRCVTTDDLRLFVADASSQLEWYVSEVAS